VPEGDHDGEVVGSGVGSDRRGRLYGALLAPATAAVLDYRAISLWLLRSSALGFVILRRTLDQPGALRPAPSNPARRNAVRPPGASGTLSPPPSAPITELAASSARAMRAVTAAAPAEDDQLIEDDVEETSSSPSPAPNQPMPPHAGSHGRRGG